MDIKVTPLAITQVDYDKFREIHPAPGLDVFFIKPDSHLGFLASLIPNGGDPRRAVRNLNHILRHISLSYIIEADSDEIENLIHTSALVITKLGKRKYIATGTLETWKITAIDSCIKEAPFETRYILNYCVLFIEKAGLQDVFGNYGKQTLADKTFTLHRKE